MLMELSYFSMVSDFYYLLLELDSGTMDQKKFQV